jgi:hypothetical protein
MHGMKDKGISVGDAIVVCDAGGGTVDLITYEAVSLNPFKLKELVSANGKWFNSSTLLFQDGNADWVSEAD